MAEGHRRSRVFFTVIIPTHNRPHLLRQAVDSVLAQTYADFELLVVDDGSEVPARQVLADYDDPRLKVCFNERTPGANGARNTGILAARGAWIAFLDDDDLWLPEKLATVHEKAREVDEDCVLIYSGRSHIDAAGTTVLDNVCLGFEGEVSARLLHHQAFGGFSCAVVRRKVAVEVGGTDEDFPSLQDLDFYYRVALEGTFVAIPEPLVLYRFGPDRITSDDGRQLEGWMKYCHKHRAALARNPRARNANRMRVCYHAFRARRWWVALSTLPSLGAGLLLNTRRAWSFLTGIGVYVLRDMPKHCLRRR